MCNVYSYMRISTSEERDLQRFPRQESALQRYAKENDIEYLLEFREDKSGKNFTERKQWQKLESIVQPGDTIVFKDICRFTREAEVGYMKYMELLNYMQLLYESNLPLIKKFIKGEKDRIKKICSKEKESVCK